MKSSINAIALTTYTINQINNFFPDGEDNLINEEVVSNALKRIDYCFSYVTLPHYFDGTESKFNHLFSDHYVMYLWYLSNVIYVKHGKNSTSNKLYYLNKALNGLDCMYDTEMPKVFLIFHGVGTMLGKAKYGEFFVALQGCTVGSHKGKYPTLGAGVSLTANSSVIGECTLGDRSTVSTRTTLFKQDLQNDNTAYLDFNSGKLQIRLSENCYAQQFFNINLKTI